MTLACENNYKSITELCVKETNFSSQILSVKQIGECETHIISARVGFYSGADFSMSLYLVQKSNNSINLCTIAAEFLNNEVKLQDIGVFNKNKGYASELMTFLLNFCKENKVQTVTGFLSEIDFDHRERLVAFYSKHGFEIFEDNTIRKSLV